MRVRFFTIDLGEASRIASSQADYLMNISDAIGSVILSAARGDKLLLVAVGIIQQVVMYELRDV